MKRQPQRLATEQSGMTLLELLISLTLTMLIMTSLYAGMHLAGRAWQSGNDIAEKTSDQLLVRDWLRRQLARMPLILSEPSPGKKQLEFSGNREQLRFIGEIPAHLGGGGLNEMQLLLSEEHNLVLQYRPWPETLRDQYRPWKQRTLLEDVELLGFSYYGNPSPELSPGWETRWSGEAYLPLLISIEILLHDEEQPWPPLLIPVMIDGSTDRPSPILISKGDGF
jgi:type II secretory pathway component PulJ